MRIPVGDVDHKLDVIDHVNQDHTEELMAIARGYYLQGSVQSAKLSDIFEDGVELEIHRETDRIPELLFVPFEIDGSLEDKILYLAFAAVVKQEGTSEARDDAFLKLLPNRTLQRTSPV